MADNLQSWKERRGKSIHHHIYLCCDESHRSGSDKIPDSRRIIKDIKTILHKTLGRSHFSFERLKSIITDIECHINNRPLTYIETEIGEGKVLRPNSKL